MSNFQFSVTAYSPLGSTDSPVMQEPLVVSVISFRAPILYFQYANFCL